MTMQDRVYAVAIFLIIGLMCIGVYVAVSGFLNANPEGIRLPSDNVEDTPVAGIIVAIPTETPAPPTNTPRPTRPPTRTPVGFVASPVPVVTRPPTLDFIPTVPTAEQLTPTATFTATPTGCGAEFCPRLGPADARGPGGNPCPSDYVWGFVYGRNGEGMSGIKVHFRDNSGNAGQTDSKGNEGEQGKYDIPLGGGTWIVEVMGRKEAILSPAFAVVVGQPWSGSGSCPTHVDFYQQ